MDTYIKELEERLKQVAVKFAEELSGVRSGRPSSEMIGNIKFNYYDQMTQINAAGTINVLPPRTITIEVWDKSAIPVVAKAIEEAQAGFSVSVNGNTIHANLAALSSERREELMKLVKKTTEKFRIEVRSVREEIMKKLKVAEDNKELTEDGMAKAKEEVQKRVNAANDALEATLEKKVAELSE